MKIVAALVLCLSLTFGRAVAEVLPRVDGLPYELTQTQVGEVHLAGNHLTLTAPAGTDLFNPKGKPAIHTAPRVTFIPPDGDFVFAVKAHATFGAAYGGPGLVVWSSEDYWAKLLFEALDDKSATIPARI